MKRIFLTSAAVLALTGLAAQAQMIFTPGEDDRFNWASLEEFKASHTGLEGQSFKILGPWLGGDKDLFESIIPYFQEATGVRVEYSGSD
ncbi:MAG: alpha-glucoside ABC transporter substrate-binding protein, partial [Paracoccus sp. (in: a-proteobacteria)]|nr:alpha-glucoside ABC transporter substrate-binding protein [Paracoccus sp. (in: a-proteobacteria)]